MVIIYEYSYQGELVSIKDHNIETISEIKTHFGVSKIFKKQNKYMYNDFRQCQVVEATEFENNTTYIVKYI